jgi:HSP20 family protein
MAYITHFAPFRTTPFTATPFGALVDQLFQESGEQTPTGERWSGFSPRTDVINDEKGVTLNMELPGVPRANISLSVENGVLTVSGEKSASAPAEKESWGARERLLGKFERSFRLGEELDGESIAARHADGVLTLTIARKQQSLPRKIEIQ